MATQKTAKASATDNVQIAGHAGVKRLAIETTTSSLEYRLHTKYEFEKTGGPNLASTRHCLQFTRSEGNFVRILCAQL